MLTIRLQRVGKKKQPVFRIVLAEKHRAAKKLAVEILGHYNPRTKEFAIRDSERLKYWVEKKVEISPTVHNLLIDKGLLSGQKVKAWKPKHKAAPTSTESGVGAPTSPGASVGEEAPSAPTAPKAEGAPAPMTAESTETK